MDEIVAKVMGQAVNIAIRSGITITGGYALSQCSRLLQITSSSERRELERLQGRLGSKVRIIAPAIDMIELIAARGNTTLESAISLTKSLRWDIQSLGVRIANAASEEEKNSRGRYKGRTQQQQSAELRAIVEDIKRLLDQIEDAVPLISLAITTSGVTLSTNLPVSISPSRLLQASTFLTAGDSKYAVEDARYTQIGPAFSLSLYMLFAGHAHRPVDEESLRSTTWKEVIHKARVKLVRVPLTRIYDMPFESTSPDEDQTDGDFSFHHMSAERPANDFAYQLTMIEDFDDDRFHDSEELGADPQPLDDVLRAGVRTILPIHEVSKIFYADTGKILNISADSNTNNPILLLKRDPHAPAPRRMMDSLERDESERADAWAENHTDSKNCTDQSFQTHSRTINMGLPSGLDPEWMAFEVYNEEPEDDADDDDVPANETRRRTTSVHRESRQSSVDPEVVKSLAKLHLTNSTGQRSTPSKSGSSGKDQLIAAPHYSASESNPKNTRIFAPNIRTSLSLLEMLIRLTSLQQFQQSSHLAITDELLNFFLEESSTTGAVPGNNEERKRIRMQARSHIGFDPYDESPIKRRGESYQERADIYDEDYQGGWGGWGDEPSVHYSPEPSSEESRMHSPMLLRSREHSSHSRSGTPEMLPEGKVPSTPPVAMNTRSARLRSDAARQTRGSPLAGQPSSANDDDETSDTPASN